MPDGNLLTVAVSGYPQQLVIAQWEGSKAEILAQYDGRSTFAIASGIFPTPDGEIWYAWHFGIARLVNGEWQTVGEGIPRPWGGYRVINQDGPPWVFWQDGPGWMLNRDKEKPLPLRRLVYEHPIHDVRIEEFTLVGDPPPVAAVYDALSWEPGVVLLATDVGLRFCDTATGSLEFVTFPVPDERVWRLCRDKADRLWLGGAGLWMSDLSGQILHSFSEVPVVGKRGVSALGLDPEHEDGVIVALGDHGIVYLQVNPNAAP
jgi:hypothetical protein